MNHIPEGTDYAIYYECPETGMVLLDRYVCEPRDVIRAINQLMKNKKVTDVSVTEVVHQAISLAEIQKRVNEQHV